MYRLGLTPWERYGKAAASSIAGLLDREESERSRPLGRALDLGCGRGQYTPELARRGWQATGIDNVPADSAQTDGLGWPMNRTSPQWYRFRRSCPDGGQ
jgi:SAM-dependent methyltransferase